MQFRVFCLALVLCMGIGGLNRIMAQFEDDSPPSEFIDPDTGEPSGGVGVSLSLCIKTIEQASCQDKFGPKPADTAQCNNDLCTFVCDGPQSVFLARPTWETDVDRATITPKGQWGKKGTLGTHKCTVTRTCDCKLDANSGTYKCKGSMYQILESFATPNFNDPVEICVGR